MDSSHHKSAPTDGSASDPIALTQSQDVPDITSSQSGISTERSLVAPVLSTPEESEVQTQTNLVTSIGKNYPAAENALNVAIACYCIANSMQVRIIWISCTTNIAHSCLFI